MYALKEKFEYRINRSNKTHFSASCRDKDRKFKLSAVCDIDGSYWTIKKFEKVHSCKLDFRNNSNRQAPIKVITAEIANKLLVDGYLIRPKDVVAEMRLKHGIDILYNKAWKAKEYAESFVYGEPLQSFQKLPSYLYMLEQAIPGTVTKMQTDSKNRFQYLFMALGPSINGFLSGCRPVISIDATYLKGKYRGVLFVAAAKDGNEQIYPLAFGFADGETVGAWTWFLSNLHSIIGSPPELMLISDRHKSIEMAVNKVFPLSAHGLCGFHMKQNIIGKYKKNKKVIKLFELASRVYRISDFDHLMEELKNIEPNAYDYLIHVNIRKCTRAHSPVQRYHIMTMNIAESMNSALRFSRKLPICTCVEFVRSRMQKWFNDRRNHALTSTCPLTEAASDFLTDSIECSHSLEANPVDNSIYLVKDGRKDGIVNLKEKTCSCRKFQFELLPCRHAVAAIRYVNISYLRP